MKNFLAQATVIIIAIGIGGGIEACRRNNHDYKPALIPRKFLEYEGHQYHEVEITGGGQRYLIHSQNCTNRNHQANQ